MNIFIVLLIIALLFAIFEVTVTGCFRILVYFLVGSIFSALALRVYLIKVQTNEQFIRFRDKTYPDFSENKKYQHWLIDNPKKKRNK